MIAIQKSEIETLRLFNNIVTVCSSAASGIGLLGAGFLWDSLADKEITRLEWPWLFAAGIGFLFFFTVGLWAWWSRKSRMDGIWQQGDVG